MTFIKFENKGKHIKRVNLRDKLIELGYSTIGVSDDFWERRISKNRRLHLIIENNNVVKLHIDVYRKVGKKHGTIHKHPLINQELKKIYEK